MTLLPFRSFGFVSEIGCARPKNGWMQNRSGAISITHVASWRLVGVVVGTHVVIESPNLSQKWALPL